jgi:ERCC4-related helicase
MALADALFSRDILFYDTSSVHLYHLLSLLLPPIHSCVGVCAQGFIGQASKAATENQEAVKGLNQKEQAVILQVRTHGQ